MKKLFLMAIIFMLFLVSTASGEEPIKLNFGIHDPPLNPLLPGAYIPWVENINNAAQGAIKIDLYPEEVYTFTPQGKVLSFPAGATPIDFAFAIHTEVGYQCVGAKVNGKIVPLRYEMRNGDIVEIMTQSGRHPSRDWLTFVKTSRARSKIRAWLNASERERSTALGRELTEKEFRRYKRTLKSFADEGRLEAALSKMGFAELDDFFAAVGYGKTTPQSLLSALVPDSELEVKPEGSVLTRTSVAINGVRGHVKDIPAGKQVNVYWIPDASKAGEFFAKKIDVVLSEEELEERFGASE